MRIKILTPNEDVIELKVDKRYTFWQLKALIGAYLGYPRENILVIHWDNNPPDDDTLESKGIRPNSLISFDAYNYDAIEEKFAENIKKMDGKFKFL